MIPVEIAQCFNLVSLVVSFLLLDKPSTSGRRELLQKAAALTAGLAMGTLPQQQAANAYTVPDLAYPFEALEPYIDTPTMKIHHDKHHGTFVRLFLCFCRSL